MYVRPFVLHAFVSLWFVPLDFHPVANRFLLRRAERQKMHANHRSNSDSAAAAEAEPGLVDIWSRCSSNGCRAAAVCERFRRGARRKKIKARARRVLRRMLSFQRTSSYSFFGIITVVVKRIIKMSTAREGVAHTTSRSKYNVEMKHGPLDTKLVSRGSWMNTHISEERERERERESNVEPYWQCMGEVILR